MHPVGYKQKDNDEEQEELGKRNKEEFFFFLSVEGKVELLLDSTTKVAKHKKIDINHPPWQHQHTAAAHSL